MKMKIIIKKDIFGFTKIDLLNVERNIITKPANIGIL